MITTFTNTNDPVSDANDRLRDAIIADLREIFEDSIDSDEFLGFENTPVTTFTINNYPIDANANDHSRDTVIANLREIFEDSMNNSEFFGFENTSGNLPENRNTSLLPLFDSDGENSEFLGF